MAIRLSTGIRGRAFQPRRHVVEFSIKGSTTSPKLSEILDHAEAGAGEQGYDVSKRVCRLPSGETAEFLCLHFSDWLVANTVAELCNGTLMTVERASVR